MIIACTLNSSTEGLIGVDILSAMKKTAVLINVARGEIINEKDLYNALKLKHIGGAVVDTWYKYPNTSRLKKFNPSKYDLHKFKNIVMTPHVSAWSKNMIVRRAKLIKLNIENLYNKKKLINEIKFNNF